MLELALSMVVIGATYDPPNKTIVCGYFGSGCKCEAHGPVSANNPPPIELSGSGSGAIKKQLPSFEYNQHVSEIGSVVEEAVSSLDWSGIIQVHWEFRPSGRPEYAIAYSPDLDAQSIRAITGGLKNLPVFRTAGAELTFGARFEVCGHNKRLQLTGYAGS